MCLSHDVVAGQGCSERQSGLRIVPFKLKVLYPAPSQLPLPESIAQIFDHTSSSWANQFTKPHRLSTKAAPTHVPFTLWSTRSAAKPRIPREPHPPPDRSQSFISAGRPQNTKLPPLTRRSELGVCHVDDFALPSGAHPARTDHPPSESTPSNAQKHIEQSARITCSLLLERRGWT